MNKIEYFPLSTKNGTQITVMLDGKRVGIIKMVMGGWQYWPNGSKTGGDVFKTLPEVKKSLEIL